MVKLSYRSLDYRAPRLLLAVLAGIGGVTGVAQAKDGPPAQSPSITRPTTNVARAVPEVGTLSLLAIGGLGIVTMAIKRRRK